MERVGLFTVFFTNQDVSFRQQRRPIQWLNRTSTDVKADACLQPIEAVLSDLPMPNRHRTDDRSWHEGTNLTAGRVGSSWRSASGKYSIHIRLNA
jgi:hypothetical protein